MWRTLEFSINEPDTWQFSLIGPTEKKISKIHSISLEAKNKKTEFPFIVLIKKSGKYAGSTRFTILI
jgi:hypothetical protein